MTTIRTAAETLLHVCDGAFTKDGQGFNKLDAGFVRHLVEDVKNFTPNQEQVLLKILKKYTAQLASHGIKYDDLKAPLVIPPQDKLQAQWEKMVISERVQFCLDHGLEGKIGSKDFKSFTDEEKTSLRKPGAMKLDYTVGPKFSNFILHSYFEFADKARAIPMGRWIPENKVWSYADKLEVVEALRPYIQQGIIRTTPAANTAMEKYLAVQEQRKMAADIKAGTREVGIPIPLKTKPFSCQVAAFGIGSVLDQSALLMEQGTGKTLSAIAVAGYRFQQKQVKRLLVVCPLSVISVWHNEFFKHANFPYRMVDLSKKDDNVRANLLSVGPSDRLWVAVINYESVWRCPELLMKWNPDMVIADESQKIKNAHAKQSKALHSFNTVKYRMILSGTPVTQNPLDIWSQYKFLNPDIFGKRFRKFRDQYATMGGYGGYEIIGYKHLDELANKAHSIAFRITKAEALDLPPTVDQSIEVELSAETRAVYNQMEKNFLIELENDKTITAPIVLTKLLRLQQLTGGFVPDDDKVIHMYDSAKLEALKELLDDLPHQKKVVIFARFVPEVKAIEKLVEKLKRKSVSLYGEVKDRGGLIESFQNDPTVTIFIAQIQTGGLGITLTAADTVIFYSTTFSFADYDQAKARVHRIGQSRSVTYIHLVTKNTVDEDVLDSLRTKGDMADLVMNRMRKRWSKNISNTPFTNSQNSFRIKLSSPQVDNEKEENTDMAKTAVATKKVTPVKGEELESKLKGLKEEAEGDTAEVAEEPTVEKTGKGARKEKAEKSGKSEKTSTKKTPKADNENIVTLKELADEAGKDPKDLRKTLRKAEGVSKPEGGTWAWEKGSEELAAVRQALGLDEPKAKAAVKKVAKK